MNFDKLDLFFNEVLYMIGTCFDLNIIHYECVYFIFSKILYFSRQIGGTLVFGYYRGATLTLPFNFKL